MAAREIIRRHDSEYISSVLKKDRRGIKEEEKKKNSRRLGSTAKTESFLPSPNSPSSLLFDLTFLLPDEGMFPYGGWRDLEPRRISQERKPGGRIDNRGTGTRSFIIGHEWKKKRKSTTTTLYARRHWTSATAAAPLFSIQPPSLDSNTISPLSASKNPLCSNIREQLLFWCHLDVHIYPSYI